MLLYVNIAYTSRVYYRPQRSWAKVMFLQVCVILFTGGVSASVHTPRAGTPPWVGTPLGRYTPARYTPPGQVHPNQQIPSRQVHPPCRYTPPAGTPRAGTPPPARKQTPAVNERPVRILLECILIYTVHFRQGK